MGLKALESVTCAYILYIPRRHRIILVFFACSRIGSRRPFTPARSPLGVGRRPAHGVRELAAERERQGGRRLAGDDRPVWRKTLRPDERPSQHPSGGWKRLMTLLRVAVCISIVYSTQPLHCFGIFCLLEAWIKATIRSDVTDATSLGLVRRLRQARLTSEPAPAAAGRQGLGLVWGRRGIEVTACSGRAHPARGRYAELGTGATPLGLVRRV